MRPPLFETDRTTHGIRWQRIKGGHHRVDRIGKLLARDNMCAGRVSDFDQCFAEQAARILQPGEEVRSDGCFLHQLPATIAECQQMPGEIAAVHRRNVLRFERVEIISVIPVVEVSAEQFHLAQRRQRSFEALDGFQCA